MSLALSFGDVIFVQIRLGCKSFIDRRWYYSPYLNNLSFPPKNFSYLTFLYPAVTDSSVSVFQCVRPTAICTSTKKGLCLKYFIGTPFHHLILLAKLPGRKSQSPPFIRGAPGSTDLLSMGFKNFHYKSLFSGIYNSAIKILP